MDKQAVIERMAKSIQENVYDHLTDDDARAIATDALGASGLWPVWKPIATQPMDGRLVLHYMPGGIVIVPAVKSRELAREERKQLAKEGAWPNYREYTATHWMPLPAAPETAQQGEV